MSTQFRRWAVRILGSVALPTVLALGLSAGAASAAPTAPTAPTVTSSTQQATTPNYYVRRYGPFYSYNQCRYAQRRYGGHYSYCRDHYRYYHRSRYYRVWYLFVRYPR